MASSIAATIMSGSICFSRLICSIVWYSRLAIPVAPCCVPRLRLNLYHQIRLQNPRERQSQLAVANRQFDIAVGNTCEPALEILCVLDGLVQPNLCEPPGKSLVVRGLDQLPIESRRTDFEHVTWTGDQVFYIQNHAQL